jgi:DNA-directed RNA polymerase specialized sigma24 family protein
VAQTELLKMLGNSMARLPENRRRAVVLHLRGYRTEEIAQRAGWSNAKARNLVYRGLSDLRQRLSAAGFATARH